MKKSLLALAVLGAFAGSAVAQSSVTLFGVADANISSSKGGASRLTAVGSGGWNGSRWGLRGSEDLGGGLKANFTIEGGYGIDTGTQQQGALFGRQAWVGLGGGFGEVRLGRQYTPSGSLTDQLGPLGTKGADLFWVAGASGTNAQYRTDNAITYLSPNLGGLTFAGQYSLQVAGAELNKPNEKVGQHFGLNVMYKGGPFQGGLAVIDFRDTAVAAGKQKFNGVLGYVGFTFAGVTLKAAYDKTDVGAAEDKQILGLSVEAPLGPVVLGAGIAKAKDVTGAANVKDDATLFTVQALYNLSKRTALYTTFTGVSNDIGSALGYNSPANDKKSDMFQVGIRHFF